MYDKVSGNKLVTFNQNVSEEGKDKWEELNIGLTVKEPVDIEVICENTSTTTVFFDEISVKVQSVPTTILVQENHYYPFGLGMRGLDWTAPSNAKEDKFSFQSKEKQTDFDLNLSDFEARSFDYQIDRTTSIDPHAENYYSLSPYAFLGNNPINIIDPDGKDIYLLIWFSKDGVYGHSGIAVDNYKQEKYKEVVNGEEIEKTRWVKDGTLTYFDLWPRRAPEDSQHQKGITADYNKRIINSLEDLKNTDVSASGRSGYASQNGEGKSAEGIVKVTTKGYEQDKTIMEGLETIQKSKKAYNSCSYNCSTFAQEALKMIDSNVDASQIVKPTSYLERIAASYYNYTSTSVVAPNNLYNAAVKMKGAKPLEGYPASVIAKPYLQYVQKRFKK